MSLFANYTNMATLEKSSIQSSFGIFGIDSYFCMFLVL
jgi:hypothetical protein